MALSLGSPPVVVNDLPALWCPDFPPSPPKGGNSGHLAFSNVYLLFYTIYGFVGKFVCLCVIFAHNVIYLKVIKAAYNFHSLYV